MLSTVKFVMKAEAELTKIILLGADFFIKSVFKEKLVRMYDVLYTGCQNVPLFFLWKKLRGKLNNFSCLREKLGEVFN